MVSDRLFGIKRIFGVNVNLVVNVDGFFVHVHVHVYVHVT